MLFYTVFMLSVALTVQGVTEDGFTSMCDSNTTFFVQKGKVATFYVNNSDGHSAIVFKRGITKRKILLIGDTIHPDDVGITILDDKVNITILDRYTINITLSDVEMDDNGVYTFEDIRSPTYCWELIVLDIWNAQGIQTFEEFRPAYINASPHASRLVRPRVNATSTWLLDSLTAKQSSEFIEKDGQMIIFSISRRFNGKNATYRVVEDDGNMHEVNMTISVTYGPILALQFSATKAHYCLTSGDELPDITCTTDCNPTCQITWDRSGVGNVLSVGKVDLSSTGMYTCRATRNGSDDVVEKILYIEVTDNTSFIIALAVLGTMQGITLVCLGVCAVCMYRMSGRNGACIKIRDSEVTNQQVYEQAISSVAMAIYEGLDNTQTGTNETYETLNTDNVTSAM